MRVLPVLILLLQAGCPAPGQDSSPPDDSTPLMSDPGITGVIPLLEIERLDDPGVSMVSAYGWGPMDRVPAWQRWGELWEYTGEVLAEEGECALVDSWVAAWCPDGCAADEYCGPNDQCETWWAQLDPGQLTLEAPSLELDYQLVSGLLSPGSGVGDDVVDPGDVVTITATGAELPAFEASAQAPATMASTLDCGLGPVSGQDLEISWEPVMAPSTITLEIIAVYHAGNGPMIRCDSPDDGSIVVPASIIDGYLPHQTPAEVIQITRWTEDVADLGQDRGFALRIGSQQACY